MQVKCFVHRLDENAHNGVLFNTLREAIDHIKTRAADEGKTVKDYTVIPIEIEDEI